MHFSGDRVGVVYGEGVSLLLGPYVVTVDGYGDYYVREDLG